MADAAGPLPMFPLSNVLFPHAPLSLHVFEPRYRQLTADCLAANGQLGIVLITRGSEVGGNDQRATVGTLAQIARGLPMPDGRWLLLLVGLRRIRINEWLVDDPYPRAFVEDLEDEGFTDPSVDAADGSAEAGAALAADMLFADTVSAESLSAEAAPGGDDGEVDEPVVLDPVVAEALSTVRLVRGLLSEAGRGPAMADEEANLGANFDIAGWRLCHASPMGPLDRQSLLETRSAAARLDLLNRLNAEMVDDLQRMLSGG